MISFIRNSALAYALVGPPRLPTVEEWANLHKDKATPDEIIAASIIESMALDFWGWIPVNYDNEPLDEEEQTALTFEPEPASSAPYVPSQTRLYHAPKQLLLTFTGGFQKGKQVSSFKFRWHWHPTSVIVNNEVTLNEKETRTIASAYRRLRQEHLALKEAQERAIQELTETNKKWDFVEKHLGLKRNGLGQIVEKEDESTHQSQRPAVAPRPARTRSRKRQG
jgi:hypothetical protein